MRTTQRPLRPDDGAVSPAIRDVGLTGLLVTFGDDLSDAANAAATAFREAVDAAGLDGVLETSTSPVSTFVLFDPIRRSRDALRDELREMAGSRDWSRTPRVASRRRWRIKAAFGGEHGPQLAEAASLAGLSPEAAAAEIVATRLRVITIGFAPGQPYLGTLPPRWDLPRLPELIPRVPAGALVVALRQLVLFTSDTPTGWRLIGRTAFRNFEPDADAPFRLRTGDEVELVRVDGAELDRLLADPARAGAAELADAG